MAKYLIIVTTLCFSMKTALTNANLQQQNESQDQINPVNDYENADNSVKDQDKRTIFNPTVVNYGLAKHVGYHPSGFKHILGYSSVDLKYSPVIRPISIKHHGYASGRPRLHFHVKKPVIHIKSPRPIHHAGWKSTRPAIRPILPVNISPPHQHLVSKPVAVSKPVHVDHLHTHVDHVHVKPVQHVDHVHQFPVPHVDHVHENPVHPVAVQHTDHVHSVLQPLPFQHVHVQPIHQVPPPLPVPAPQPLVTVAASVPFVPSPLFEVTKPDLGVLPLGTVFSSPVLRNIPTTPTALPTPFKPALIPPPVAPVAVPSIHPVPLPVPRPAIIPQSISPQPVYPPGTFVEYHGNTNFINLLKEQVSDLPQTPVNTIQSGLPHHFHFQYPQPPQSIPPGPQQHNVQFLPANHPHIFQQPSDQSQFQQQLPANTPTQQHNVQTQFLPADHPHIFQQPSDQSQFQQQLPVNTPTQFHSNDQVDSHNIYQQQLPINSNPQFQTEQDNQHFFQQQLPQDSTPHYQPADQVSTQHFYHQSMNAHQDQFQPVDQTENENNGYVYQQPDISNLRQSIQPGQTDVQLPIHLPQHPGFVQSSRQFQHDNFQDPQYSESVFRPSIQLEPPYKK